MPRMMRTVNTDHKWLNIPKITLAQYNWIDCLATGRISPALKRELTDNGQLKHFMKTYWPLVPAVVAMSKRGLQVDKEALAAYANSVHKEIEDTDATIRTFSTNTEFNINSSQQKATWLYEEMGLKCGKYTEGGAPSSDQEAVLWILRNLRKKDAPFVPALHALLHRSRYNTIRMRYLKLDFHEDGRVRPTVKMGKVETLRLAYADPPLQQWPKEGRHVFVPGPGKVFLAADFKQLEARILAALSNDTVSLQAFAKGEDIHASNARDLFRWTKSEWKAMDSKPREQARNFAKTFLYGISYGGHAETMKTKTFCPCPKCEDKVPNTLDLKRKEIKLAEQRWFSLHFAVHLWRDELTKKVMGSGGSRSYTTPFGYKRYFFTPWPSVLTELYNFPMQSTAAGLINRCTIKLHEMRAPIVLNMHDELMLEVDEWMVDYWAKRMKSVMEEPIPELGDTSFPVDLAVGKNWRDMEELT